MYGPKVVVQEEEDARIGRTLGTGPLADEFTRGLRLHAALPEYSPSVPFGDVELVGVLEEVEGAGGEEDGGLAEARPRLAEVDFGEIRGAGIPGPDQLPFPVPTPQAPPPNLSSRLVSNEVRRGRNDAIQLAGAIRRWGIGWWCWCRGGQMRTLPPPSPRSCSPRSCSRLQLGIPREQPVLHTSRSRTALAFNRTALVS